MDDWLDITHPFTSLKMPKIFIELHFRIYLYNFIDNYSKRLTETEPQSKYFRIAYNYKIIFNPIVDSRSIVSTSMDSSTKNLKFSLLWCRLISCAFVQIQTYLVKHIAVLLEDQFIGNRNSGNNIKMQ